MADLIRDAPFGQLVRYLTGNRVFKYEEEKAGFVIPDIYTSPRAEKDDSSAALAARSKTSVHVEESGTPSSSSSSTSTSTSEADEITRTKSANLARTTSRASSHRPVTLADLEKQLSVTITRQSQPNAPIEPSILEDGTIIIDWYTTTDPANPQNWTFGKKSIVLLQILLYTMAVYMGSAIYAPSIEGVMHEFGVSLSAASLGLSMYVLAYGIGPMLFSPLSEIPAVGRSPPYTISYAIFVVLLVPSALVDNFAGLIVLRFLQGFFGSPCLATGAASIQDIYSIVKLPYGVSLWTLAATCGPSIGPIISGFSVAAKTWRWSLWEMLWLNGPIFFSLFFLLPETSSANILLRRAQRLRKLTGNENLKSQSEIDQAQMSPREVTVEALWRPLQLMLLDPAIAFTAVYTALVYGIYYSFFESFPLVFGAMHGFNLGQTGLTFLSVAVGVVLAVAAYWVYIYFSAEPAMRSSGLGTPERRLIPGLVTTFLIPAGLFLFAWTARPDVHWIVPCIGIAISIIGINLVIQSLFMYLPMVYPEFAASLFAGNDLARSSLAAGAIHFSTPLFTDLGVSKGVSLLAGLTVACSGGIFILFFFGASLRARSRFAAKY